VDLEMNREGINFQKVQQKHEQKNVMVVELLGDG
jgi:hypothetical protein